MDLIDECCDSYALIELKYFDYVQSKKSKVVKKTANPHFNESFVFEVPTIRFEMILILLFFFVDTFR